jgi:hypothetical protein
VLKIKQPRRRDILEFHDDLPQQSEPSPLGGVGFVSEIKDDWTCQRQRLSDGPRREADPSLANALSMKPNSPITPDHPPPPSSPI